MTFSTLEMSVEDSIPIELYLFVFGTVEIRLADTPGNISFDSETWVGTPGLSRRDITREPVTSGSVKETEITIAASALSAYVPGQPPNPARVTIIRVQDTFSQELFDGDIASFGSGGDTGEELILRCESKTGSKLRRQMPGNVCAPHCRYALYSNKCQVLRTSFDTSTTVSSVNGSTIVVGSAGAFSLVGGEIWGPGDEERRMIVSQTGTTIVVDIPFIDLVATDAVTLYAGCDKSIVTCESTFNNAKRHGGMPYAPFKNPHTTSLKVIT